MESKSVRQQEFKVHLVLPENEARALHDIVAYGFKSFIDVFKEKLGKCYIEKHEEDCKKMFEAIYDQFPKHFHKFDEARKIFEK